MKSMFVTILSISIFILFNQDSLAFEQSSVFHSLKKAITTNCDSSCKNNKYSFFNFDEMLKNHSIYIDSLLKKYRVEIDIDRNFNEDFFKKFKDKIPKFWNDIPKIDKEKFDELLRELDKNIDKDSLLKKFRFFRKRDLFDNSELTEI